MLRAYGTLRDVGAALDGTAWNGWWRTRMLGHRGPGHALDTVDAWRTAAAANGTRPPAGVTWDTVMAHAWGRAMGGLLLETVEEAQRGVHPQHENALTSVMAVDGWFTAWGLQTAATRGAFLAGLGETRPAWEALLRAGTPNLRANEAFVAQRDAWLAARSAEYLEAHLPTMAPERPIRPRL